MSNFCIDGFNRTEKNQKGLEKDETNKQMSPYLKWPKVNKYPDKPEKDNAHHLKKKGIFPILLPKSLKIYLIFPFDMLKTINISFLCILFFAKVNS